MNWTSKNYSMFSASGEIMERIWRKVECKNGDIWVYPPNDPEPGAHCWIFNPSDKNSEGCGGRIIPFKLEDGTIIEAKGPWNSNSDSMFKATGIDLRNHYLTFVVLGKTRSFGKNLETIIEDVIYQDKKPTLGSYDRYKELIKQYPEAKQYYMESHGGSCSGPIK